MVRRTGSIRFEDEDLKSIHVCDLFYRVALDIARPLPETRTCKRYILVAIDHYSKWCEAKAVADHGAKTAAKFLEDDVICRYGVPIFVLTDNGGQWAVEFDAMCKDYGIHHQHTAPQWPQCNGMAERLIKMINHGITYCLQHLTMQIVGMSNWQRLCLDTDAGLSLAQSSLLL
jgi:transposase InsO family protein